MRWMVGRMAWTRDWDLEIERDPAGEAHRKGLWKYVSIRQTWNLSWAAKRRRWPKQMNWRSPIWKRRILWAIYHRTGDWGRRVQEAAQSHALWVFLESRTSLRSLNQEEVDRACGANGEVAAFQAGTVGQVLRRQGRPRLTGEGGNAPPRFVRPRK